MQNMAIPAWIRSGRHSGVKFAEPDKEVYCVVGDSAFRSLHSEIMTIMQERQKVNI